MAGETSSKPERSPKPKKEPSENPRPNNRGTDAAKVELLLFGEHLKGLREQAGLTQEGLSASAGMHRVSLARAETGQMELGVLNVKRLAAALGLPPAALFE